MRVQQHGMGEKKGGRGDRGQETEEQQQDGWIDGCLERLMDEREDKEEEEEEKKKKKRRVTCLWIERRLLGQGEEGVFQGIDFTDK